PALTPFDASSSLTNRQPSFLFSFKESTTSSPTFIGSPSNSAPSSKLTTAIATSSVFAYGSHEGKILNHAYIDGKIISATTTTIAARLCAIFFTSVLKICNIFFIKYLLIYLYDSVITFYLYHIKLHYFT